MISCTGFFVLCTVLTPALGCDWLRHYSHFSNYSLTLVRLMGGQLTEQESPVPFPYRLYKHIRHTELDAQLIFIRDSLDLMSELYHHDNLSTVTWDMDKTHHFLIVIDRQVEELNTCVLPNRQSDPRLGKYYRRLTRRTLHSTGGSIASWEIIRKQTKLHLDQLQLLVSFILDTTTTNRWR